MRGKREGVRERESGAGRERLRNKDNEKEEGQRKTEQRGNREY